jgi:hypothetical protein
VIDTFSPEVTRRHAVEFGIHNGKETIQNGLVASASFHKEFGNFVILRSRSQAMLVIEF